MPTPNKVKALEESIQHWKENLAAESPLQASTSSQECALCQIYLGDYPTFCAGCPVSDHTGVRTCRNTPYDSADKSLTEWEDAAKALGDSSWAMSVASNTQRFKTARDNFRTHAKAEIEFLEMLLAREKLREGM